MNAECAKKLNRTGGGWWEINAHSLGRGVSSQSFKLVELILAEDLKIVKNAFLSPICSVSGGHILYTGSHTYRQHRL